MNPPAILSWPFDWKSILARKIPVLLVSLLGTLLEYFEYAIYGFLAPVLALHFFPSDDPAASLVKIFGVFAVGSLAKPVGALIFGYLGDIKGRSFVLRYTIIGISVPTFLIGWLPGYESWGWGSIILLILCRMSQGIFMAGESDGVRIYVFEHFGHKHPCLVSACIGCSAYIGIALASFVASQMPLEGNAWQWVFRVSSVFGLPLYFLRRHLRETPPFLRSQNSRGYISLKHIVVSHWPSLIRTILICGSAGGIYHFYLVFQGTYLSRTLKLISPETGGQYSLYLLCLYVLTLPVAGWASDRWGYVRVGKIGGMVTFGLGILNFLIVRDGLVFFPVMGLTTLSMAFLIVPGCLFVTQHYDVNIRFRCLSLSHMIGSTLLSGTNPLICLLLWEVTGLSYAPFMYFLFLVAIGALAFIWRAKENAYNAWFL